MHSMDISDMSQPSESENELAVAVGRERVSQSSSHCTIGGARTCRTMLALLCGSRRCRNGQCVHDTSGTRYLSSQPVSDRCPMR
eukprot:1186062-Prorocentrum_minimum.AAC.4